MADSSESQLHTWLKILSSDTYSCACKTLENELAKKQPEKTKNITFPFFRFLPYTKVTPLKLFVNNPSFCMFRL